MHILGISSWPNGHDPAASLLRDNQIIAAAEEERFIRVKHAVGCFPVNSIMYCLNSGNISLNEVDYIAMNLSDAPFPSGLNMNLIRYGLSYQFRHLLNRKKYRKYVIESFKSNFNADVEKKLRLINHHIAHASSAYRTSGFSNSMILTLDNRGEVASTLLAVGEGKEISKIDEVYAPNSLGKLYAAVTEYLGFTRLEGEGKVMGLAPYGIPVYDLSELIYVKQDGVFSLNTKYIGRTYGPKKAHFQKKQPFSDEMIKKYGPYREKSAPILDQHKNMAASLQRKVESVVLKMVENLSSFNNSRNLCLAGGVALNSKLNGVLIQSGLIDDIHIHPAASDAGTAVGAALELRSRLGYNCNSKMLHAYLGPSFSDEEIGHLLNQLKLKYDYHKDIEGIAGELVAKGSIVCLFKGAMEWGPRALGNRSIIADSSNPQMKDLINYYVKHRESFRPFAPSILIEATDEFFEDPYESPFMTICLRVKEDKVKEIPAVVHVDGSTRPQMVERSINPEYYKIIESYEEQTGLPVILNTSLNTRGEPIVCTPLDAITTFFSSGADYLILNKYLIKK